jgi:hypothetical protein
MTPSSSRTGVSGLAGAVQFKTRKEAAAALRTEIRKSEVGEWVEPSKQRVDAYLTECVDGQRLSPSTVASYRKDIRCTSSRTSAPRRSRG